MPFVAKKKAICLKERKKKLKTPVNNSNLTQENKIATQKQIGFFLSLFGVVPFCNGEPF